MFNLISSNSKLPSIPIAVSLDGHGLVKEKLVSVHNISASPEAIMASWRSRLSAEKLTFRRLYWVEEKGDKAIIHYKTTFTGKKTILIGTTDNNLTAIKILIANNLSGYYLSPIRWELYSDFRCENPIDIGRYDYWDLLRDTDETSLAKLAEKGIAPSGDWDFDSIFMKKMCPVCNNEVSINSFVYNIDSAVCAICNNRPFLTTCISRLLESDDSFLNLKNESQKFFHIANWLSSVRSNFNEVDVKGEQEKLHALWKKTIMAQALDQNSQHTVKTLVETNTNFDFGVYVAMCAKMEKAMSGAEPFSEEHAIATKFVVSTTKLMNSKRLSTSFI